MHTAIQLYGYLILTFLGFAIPIFVLLLSISQKGIEELSIKYNENKTNTEKRIKELTSGVGSGAGIDSDKIKQEIKRYEGLKRKQENDIRCLQPQEQIKDLFLALFASFLFVIIGCLIEDRFWWLCLSLILSVGLFIFVIVRVRLLTNILVQVSRNKSRNKDDAAQNILAMLSKFNIGQAETLAVLHNILEQNQKIVVPPFLKNVCVSIDDGVLKDDKYNISIELNKLQKFKIAFINYEKRIAKNIEVGFVFPDTFVIETDQVEYTVYASSDRTQVVRYRSDFIHGNTTRYFGQLALTALKTGECKITTFIKAENIETIYRDFILKVTAQSKEGIKNLN